MKRHDYIVINQTTKAIEKMNDICLDEETNNTWFDVHSNTFNTLMYFNRMNNSFYINENTLREINEVDLLKEAERIYKLLSKDYIRTIRPSNVNIGASIYRCIYAKVIDDKIHIFDKDQTLFVIYKSSITLKDKKEEQGLYVISQPYWNFEVDNIQAFDFHDLKQKCGIEVEDSIDVLTKKLLLSYQKDYPMPDDMFFKNVKPIFKSSTYPLPFDKKLLAKTKKEFYPTYIYPSLKSE